MDEHASFGARMGRRRKALDLTQAELDKRIGCALGTIRKIETDERRPSKQIATRLADQLRLAPEELAVFLKAARAEVGVDRLAPPAQLVPPPTVAAALLPRGTVTFLFTDIEGSTQLWERHPQAMGTVVARHEALLREAIAAAGGVVFKLVGDAICAAFASAQDAVTDVLSAQLALQAEAWGAIGPLGVRMALHTGVVEERGGDYFGLPLSRVARLLAAGHGGQILLSLAIEELVREQLPPDAELYNLGDHQFKDLTYSERIFQLVTHDLRADFPPLRTLDQHQTNLPLQPTALIGREHEVAQVCALLRGNDTRLLTLTGPGGTGKTRLALQVAAEFLDSFADGVYFVALAPIRDPTLVIETIAATLGVKEGGDQPLLTLLKRHVRDKQLLLVLDNFEQVIAAAPLMAEVLEAAPNLKILVTSRASLQIYGECEFPVPPLALPDPRRLPPLERLTQYEAVRLFIERARAVKPDFMATDE